MRKTAAQPQEQLFDQGKKQDRNEDIMSKKEKEWKEEQIHFDRCKRLIARNVQRYQKEYEERHEQIQELYQALQSGNEELYNQLMLTTSLEEHAANQLRKNKAAFDKPYFGRIDYTDTKMEKEEKIYIGKNGVFRNRTEVVIADWRAPISSVYYENELGKGSYKLPDETSIAIDLHLKRTYNIEDGELTGYYDSDVASNDELLVKYLSRNKDVVLGEIISTIQKEQNEIIRESPFANLLVQGVAGSGKTTVAMHRISYILYNYKDRFESNEFCIIGSSDLLLNYITSGLPELDVPNIKKMRMDQLFVHLLGKEWRKKYTVEEADETAVVRCGREFMLELELYLMHLKERYVDTSPLADPRAGIILSRSGSLTLLRKNPQFSIWKLLSVLEDRMRTRIKFLMDGFEKEEIQAMLKKYRGHYKNMMPKESIYEFYARFLEEYAKEKRIDWTGHIEKVRNGQFDLYDLAALALVRYRVTQKQEDEEFGLMFLDEAQDFGISIYYVLKKILPKCYFTIMGDVSQNINYSTGMNDWEELVRLFLTDPKDRFKLLQKSYRNTIEISEYAGKILDKATYGKYKIDPVIRHGRPVEEKEFWSEPELVEYVEELLERMKKDGYQTTAIVCRDEKESDRVKKLLDGKVEVSKESAENFTKGVMVLPVRMTKGLEFDTVILWNPGLKAALSSPERAKLLYVAETRALHELYVLSC